MSDWLTKFFDIAGIVGGVIAAVVVCIIGVFIAVLYVIGKWPILSCGRRNGEDERP